MYETGKLARVTSEMRRYNLHILGVSESIFIGLQKESASVAGRKTHGGVL